jgi:hypothetical protein
MRTSLLAALLLALAVPALAQADPEVAPADLALTLATDTDSLRVGEVVTYTVTVANESEAINAVGVQIAAPARLGTDAAEFVDADATQGTFDAETGLWSAGRIDAGATAQMVVRVRATQPGGFVKCTEVAAAAQPDPDSTPYNGAAGEDDFACAAVSVE